MSLRTGQTTLAEVIRLAFEARVAEVHVSMPGIIQSFDKNTQLASVTPCLKETVTQEDGSERVEALPVINDVPVEFPGGGGCSVTFPVSKGDECVLVFQDRSLEKWIDAGGVVDPMDLRRHHISSAVARVGLRSKGHAIPGFDGTHVTIGRDGAAADFVACAQKVLDEIQRQRDLFLTHGHKGTPQQLAAGIGLVLGDATGTPIQASTSPPQSVASATVVVKG